MNNFERTLPMMLYRTLDAVMPNFRHIFTQFDLTEQQWRVLRVLWEKDQQPLLHLARATLISSPSLVGVVDRLSQRGLVARHRCEADRRVVNIGLTIQGQDLEDKVMPLVSGAYTRLENKLTPTEWETMYNALDKLVSQHKEI